jgi:hypothetical protein
MLVVSNQLRADGKNELPKGEGMEPTQLNEQTTSSSESIPLSAPDTFPIEIYTNERFAEFDQAEAELAAFQQGMKELEERLK